jgi:arylsulfatase A-like enzyme
MEVDHMVGRILEALQQNGIDGNTLLIFTADNGCSPAARIEELQEKGHSPSHIYRGHKADLYEGGHRIPCLVRWPARIKPHRIHQTVCLTDFMATFAALTGYRLKDSEGEDSYNLLPLLLRTQEKEPLREATVHHSINGDFSLRSGEWKLLLSPGSGGWSYPRPGRDTLALSTLPPIQLYNMQTDPAETDNLYRQHPEITRKLKETLLRYISEGRSTPGLPQKNATTKDWPQTLINSLEVEN